MIRRLNGSLEIAEKISKKNTETADFRRKSDTNKVI